MRSLARTLPAFVVAALVAAACAPAASPRADARPSAIYWGEEANGYMGVVQLQIAFSGATGAMCSGTLVAPRVVVTAEHCVEDEEGGPLDPSAITIHTGTTGNLARYDVEEIRHLSPVRMSGGDFAVLVAAEPVDAAPYAYAVEWEPHPGDPITLVGYGQREDGGEAGLKMRGDNTVDYVFDTYFTTVGEPGCHGDSGGPAFDDDDVLVGVIVNTLGGWVGEDTCASGVSGLTRVDSFHELVDQAVDDTWECDGADVETCGDERDNDCNRLVDEGCLAIGAPCDEGVSCASYDCRDLGDGARCTATCRIGDAEACGDGAYCDEVTCGAGACRLGAPGGGEPGVLCADDTDCRDLSCVDVGEERRCLRRCLPADVCPNGEECLDADDDGCGGCWSGSADRAPLGAVCAADTECASGQCAEDAFGSVCAQPCGDACPAGTACDAGGVCVRARPGDQPAGSPCESAADCASERCEDVTGALVCVAACEAGACPDGLVCVADRCEPDGRASGDACGSNDDCANDLCGHFGGYDACTQPCSESAPCPAGLVCHATESGPFCVPLVAPPPTETDDEGSGCGCREAPGAPTRSVLWVGFAAAAFALLALRFRV